MTATAISVIKVRNVMMVTMPADPDDSTISDLQEKVLDSMERYGARGLVLDISAVDTVDSFFARTMAETAQMVALLGGRTVIAGMRPSVAITTTQLGLSLGRAVTALDVDRALALMGDATAGR
ncbi:MAG: STAS domain-containing protein [Actinobacteria bacterium]|nr:STAS domain-containing protein [Actinomycetota bacterium]